MKHNTFHLLSVIQATSIVILLISLTGCIATKDNVKSTPLVKQTIEIEDLVSKLHEKNLKLEKQNEDLKATIDEQKQLTAQLQLSLLEKHAELNKLMVKNERLVSEFVRNKTKLRNRGNKVETVRLLAEVTAIIDTAKSNNNSGKWDDSIKLAEQYLSESQAELDIDNFDGSAYLASQALDIIQSTQLDKSEIEDAKTDTEVVFFAHLPMTVIENSNIRATPSIKAKIISVKKANTAVTATGYSGLWVKVKIKEGMHGWIHYSLLSSARQ